MQVPNRPCNDKNGTVILRKMYAKTLFEICIKAPILEVEVQNLQTSELLEFAGFKLRVYGGVWGLQCRWAII